MTDTSGNYELLMFLADASFQDTALKHNALLHKACEFGGSEGDPAKFRVFARQADLVKAAMVCQWPDAAKVWFGELAS